MNLHPGMAADLARLTQRDILRAAVRHHLAAEASRHRRLRRWSAPSTARPMEIEQGRFTAVMGPSGGAHGVSIIRRVLTGRT
jgi:hypothetical protein